VITRTQVRMARAALGWGVRDLADRAGVAPNTVSRFENGLGTNVATLKQIQSALEEAGIIFIPREGRAGPGVRLKESREDD
jgi:transcriptional regulator with XRE-family HTH domain